MTSSTFLRSVALSGVLLFPQLAAAQAPLVSASAIALNQQSTPPAAGQQAAIERAVKKFHAGVIGGIGLDPEIVIIGAHATFGPLFKNNVNFRPGIEMGFGEITTELGINLDVVFTLNENQPRTWTPYFGIGPNFALSHRGFEEDVDHLTVPDQLPSESESTSRFDFGDTDFEPGLNFIVGMRRANGLLLEMKATAYGVANVRLLVGYEF